ncbi:hypothetical protein M378DRAFT_18559 [Amanita muscaria Koide BX008]|uniref:Uncharacterized protein n=1 Tax=Amanita muscaria (strain Koide BX008) TaxID=946122 RepID=A0A0C2W0Z0_AMAMK|nr:hypothetical protein M378DRAFT_18559 [Amanita muscaria Koide BX008]
MTSGSGKEKAKRRSGLDKRDECFGRKLIPDVEWACSHSPSPSAPSRVPKCHYVGARRTRRDIGQEERFACRDKRRELDVEKQGMLCVEGQGPAPMSVG